MVFWDMSQYEKTTFRESKSDAKIAFPKGRGFENNVVRKNCFSLYYIIRKNCV